MLKANASFRTYKDGPHGGKTDAAARVDYKNGDSPRRVTQNLIACSRDTEKKIQFQLDRFRVRMTGLPAEAPDHPVTTIALECDAEPTQDNILVRKEKPRDGV